MDNDAKGQYLDVIWHLKFRKVRSVQILTEFIAELPQSPF